MIIWSGHGYLVAVITFFSSFLMELVTERLFHDDSYYQEQVWPLPTALALAGVMSFIVGRMLPRSQGRTLIDAETGERVQEPMVRHTLFFIDIKWWGPVLIAIALIVAVYRIFAVVP